MKRSAIVGFVAAVAAALALVFAGVGASDTPSDSSKVTEHLAGSICDGC